MSIQLAVIGNEGVQAAWGEDFTAAESALEYMNVNAVGLANAKTAPEISDGMHVHLLPINQSWPGVKIVPVSVLRSALTTLRRGRDARVANCTDDELLDGYLMESNMRDTQSHCMVPRFGRTTLRPSELVPVNAQSQYLLLRPGEPCLVVRLSKEQLRRGHGGY